MKDVKKRQSYFNLLIECTFHACDVCDTFTVSSQTKLIVALAYVLLKPSACKMTQSITPKSMESAPMKHSLKCEHLS